MYIYIDINHIIQTVFSIPAEFCMEDAVEQLDEAKDMLSKSYLGAKREAELTLLGMDVTLELRGRNPGGPTADLSRIRLVDLFVTGGLLGWDLMGFWMGGGDVWGVS